MLLWRSHTRLLHLTANVLWQFVFYLSVLAGYSLVLFGVSLSCVVICFVAVVLLCACMCFDAVNHSYSTVHVARASGFFVQEVCFIYSFFSAVSKGAKCFLHL